MTIWDLAWSFLIGWEESCGSAAPLKGVPATLWTRVDVTKYDKRVVKAGGNVKVWRFTLTGAPLERKVPSRWTSSAREVQVKPGKFLWISFIFNQHCLWATGGTLKYNQGRVSGGGGGGPANPTSVLWEIGWAANQERTTGDLSVTSRLRRRHVKVDGSGGAAKRWIMKLQF